MAAGDDERAVPVEVYGRDGHGVGPDRVEALTGLYLPDANRLVERPGHDEVRLRAEVHAEHKVGVALEGLYVSRLARGDACVPDTEGAVVGGGTDIVGVG